MLGTQEVAFLKWAGEKLLGLHLQDKERALDCRERVAAYFESVSACLDEMARKISSKQLPRVEGNKFEVLIDSFEITMASNFYGEHSLKSEDAGLLEELRQLAGFARGLDLEHVVAGLREEYSPHPGMETPHELKELERAAGRYAGLAATLRAIGPFGSADRVPVPRKRRVKSS